MHNIPDTYLLNILKGSLFIGEYKSPLEGEYIQVIKAAEEQKILALVSDSFQTTEGSNVVIQTKAYYMKMVYEQSRLVKMFRDYNIPLVILKGTAAAMYYPKPYLRTMGDVDFVVSYENFDEARSVLETNGYAFRGDCGDDRDYEYIKNDVVFELHHHFSKDPAVEKYVQDGIKNSVTGCVTGTEFPCLPPAENGLVILDHIRHHFTTSGIGLRHLIDWMMYAHSVLNDEFWNDRFQPMAKAAGLERFAIVLTATCKKWLGMPDDYSWCQGVDDDLMDQTIEYFLANGNFGRNLERRGTKVENVSAELKSKGRFRYLQSTGEMTWPALKKHPWLRPFAWIYQSCRFAKRGFVVLFRNKGFKKELEDGLSKGEYYRKLGL